MLRRVRGDLDLGRIPYIKVQTILSEIYNYYEIP